ncbi:MAG: ATP-binding protein [Candidatus Nanoarchaeia archaeon]|nr:ATP-binding protein [Candidatus Nanoarchaeia archaeon]
MKVEKSESKNVAYKTTLDKTRYTELQEHEKLREDFLGEKAVEGYNSSKDVIASIRNIGECLRDIHKKTFEKEKDIGLEDKLSTAKRVVMTILKDDRYEEVGNFKEYCNALRRIGDILDTYKEDVLEIVKVQKKENGDSFNLAKCVATPDEWWTLENFLRGELIGEQIRGVIEELIDTYNKLYRKVSNFFEKEWFFKKITNVWEEYVLLSVIKEIDLGDAENTGGEVSSSEFANIKEYMHNAKILAGEDSNPENMINKFIDFVRSVKDGLSEPIEDFRKKLYAHNGCEGNYNKTEDFTIDEIVELDEIEYGSKIKKEVKGLEREVEERRHALVKEIIKKDWSNDECIKKMIKFRVETTPWRIYPVLDVGASFGRAFLVAYKGDSVNTEWDDLIGIDNVKEELERYIPLFMSGTTQRKTLLLHGPPGTGKTSGMSAAAKKYGFKVVNVKSADMIWNAVDMVSQLDGHFIILLDDMPDLDESTQYQAQQEFQSLLTSAGGIKEIPENVAIAIALNIKKDKGLSRKLLRRFALKLEFPSPTEEDIKKIYKHYFKKYGYLNFKDGFVGIIENEKINMRELANVSKELLPAEIKTIVDSIVENEFSTQKEMVDYIKRENDNIQTTAEKTMYG